VDEQFGCSVQVHVLDLLEYRGVTGVGYVGNGILEEWNVLAGTASEDVQVGQRDCDFGDVISGEVELRDIRTREGIWVRSLNCIGEGRGGGTTIEELQNGRAWVEIAAGDAVEGSHWEPEGKGRLWDAAVWLGEEPFQVPGGEQPSGRSTRRRCGRHGRR
jgi:hypothetical protein